MNLSPRLLDWQALGNLVLGHEPRLRMRVIMALVGVYGYTISSALLAYAMHIGLVDPAYGWWLFAYLHVGSLGFYALVRSGWSVRLGGSANLEFEQALYAVGAILAAFALTGPVRHAVLMLMCLVLVCGMFTMTPRQVVVMGFLAVAGLGLVTLGMVQWSPEQLDPRHEWIKFILTATAWPALSAVAYYVAKVREGLQGQRRELAHALGLLQDVASRDELTRLVNRRHMKERLLEECARQQRTGTPFCLALLDLDHFKRINDHHGHSMGDAVLRNFAQAGSAALRKTDVLARWGGEEFLLLLTDETLETAEAALGRIVDKMHARLAHSDIRALRLTFSGGLTDHPPGEALNETLDRADRALYAAKAQGRNRIVTQAATFDPTRSSDYTDGSQV